MGVRLRGDPRVRDRGAGRQSCSPDNRGLCLQGRGREGSWAEAPHSMLTSDLASPASLSRARCRPSEGHRCPGGMSPVHLRLGCSESNSTTSSSLSGLLPPPPPPGAPPAFLSRVQLTLLPPTPLSQRYRVYLWNIIYSVSSSFFPAPRPRFRILPASLAPEPTLAHTTAHSRLQHPSNDFVLCFVIP